MRKVEVHYCAVCREKQWLPVWRLNCRKNGLEVETARSGLGEFSVSIDGRKVIDTNRLWYPTPSKVVAKTRALLAEQTS